MPEVSENPPKKSLLRLGRQMKEIFQSERKTRIIVVIGMIGMILILISEIFSGGEEKQVEVEQNTSISSQQYTQHLEQKLGELIESIDGVGKAKVMITLENGTEYVYAQEEKKDINRTQDFGETSTSRIQERDNSEQTIVVVDNGGGARSALIETQIEPTVKGVVVVCEGGGDILVQTRVTEAITTVLNISSTRVCVTKLS